MKGTILAFKGSLQKVVCKGIFLFTCFPLILFVFDPFVTKFQVILTIKFIRAGVEKSYSCGTPHITNLLLFILRIINTKSEFF
jgi:hypothetical protein